ncbi:MAG TPA: rhamnulose-1-phosphate aldolase [Bacteroidales bacterium]
MELNQVVIREIEKISEVAGYLWQREWAERNAGNISLDLTGLMEVSSIHTAGRSYVKCSMPAEASGLVIFVSGTGERLRDLIKTPEKAGCIIVIDRKAEGYHIVWGGEGRPEIRPTSEFVTHIAVHLFNNQSGTNHRCVVHTHPIELIALSHHKVFGHDQDALNKALWSMLPEIRLFVPKGVCIAPYTLPGSKALADFTIEGLKKYSVILWAKHGALATGSDALEAFDYLDVANKGAKIYLKCLQAGYVPEGMSDEEMKGLEIFL